MPPLERYIAIDNICAWPILNRMPDGTITCINFNQPNHGGSEGEVQCWISRDDGRTWTAAGIPVPCDPGANRMNHAAGLAHNNDLLVVVGGHDNRPPRGQNNPDFSNVNCIPPAVSRSSDNGLTWRQSQGIPFQANGWAIFPFGPILRRFDGALLLSVYNYPPSGSPLKNVGSAQLYISRDDGHTWALHTTIAPDDYNETFLFQVDEKHYLAAARTYIDQTVHLYVSHDAGDTWKLSGPVTGSYEHNAHILTLPDGKLLMTYGVRHPGYLGLACRISADKGLTWKRPHNLLTISETDSYDAGYPSCLLMGDGKILTAYYACKTPAHTRYHMGTIIWDPKEEFKKGH
jgi:hypothetical protein